MSESFTVVVRGKSFTLYRDQLEFDAPNYFTHKFLDDNVESQTRTVQLSRSPELFDVIVEYMSGYSVLPLKQEMLPSTMTMDVAKDNLLRDAEFYQLKGLTAILRRPALSILRERSLAHDAFGLAQREAVDLDDLMEPDLPTGVIIDERGIGCISEQDGWRPLAIRARGVFLIAQNESALKIALTESQRTRIFKRDRASMSGNQRDPSQGRSQDEVSLYGRRLDLMGTTWAGDSLLLINDVFISAQDGDRIGYYFGNDYMMRPPRDSPFVGLQGELVAAYSAEARGLVLTSTRLVFTVSPEGRKSSDLTFRVMLAECVTRSSLLADIVNSGK